ncbi:hypothetical protein HFP69_14930 [Streptomyces sp. ARC12]|uniref:hypothetical protein n=1 Tax=Streptomyces TaxID=1883 RepID=UPI002DDB63DF|nr:hypothetical protein [Streptomyces anulatus]WSC63332.1 hypothetical protein OHA57_22505 [Streptomyces anulatus]WSR77707.1 hypothetical protein OG274_21860 [Streptomyces anulatus]WTC63919.1 hypothetical protein OG865_15835 [Streptomyces anulatus]WTC73051.1 hypothetical protein OG882_23090 [Streptomyces anulatus]
MTAFGITAEEQVELDKALYDALDPLASAIRSRLSGLPEDRKWEGEPVEVALSVLAAWKVVDTEVKRLTATAAGTAGTYGASYEQLGSVWGITRQGARKKWPEAVSRPGASANRTVELCGGTAELTREPDSGGWRWTGVGADGTRGAAEADVRYATPEEAAAHAGAFLKGRLRVDGAAMRREADDFFGTEDRVGGEGPWGREGD